ncbi:MAG: hypothetical protein JJ892_05490 [Balneola sp.]|nr:hypothetical protein [Balneola sp.]MBO6650521.1 hypothetical protein [Balneola sp.]MBO6711518.1 hypothetical protein [Balneola sp.]MBO6799714.1 hypothetical protein [Balneola sp.]MBO6870845.1 hypothetical protein [Balneola sp.]
MKVLKSLPIIVLLLFFNTSCCSNFGFPNPTDSELIVYREFEHMRSPMDENVIITPSDYMHVDVNREDACGNIKTRKVIPRFNLSADSTSSVIITQSKGDTLKYYGYDIDQDTLDLKVSWDEESTDGYFEVNRNFQIIVSFFDNRL